MLLNFFISDLFYIKDRVEHGDYRKSSSMYSNISVDTFNSNDEEVKSKEKFVLKKINKDGSPDMRYKENRDHYLPPNTNKDGSMDLRKLKNRKKLGLYKD
jgi:hypothetical protein